MHIVSSVIFLTTLLVWSTTASVHAEERTESSSEILVNKLLTEVQRALLTVQNSTEKEDIPPLDSVTLQLSTQFVKEGGGKVNIYIISLGAMVSEDVSHTIRLKLSPPKPGTGANVSGNKISDQLAEAIKSAARAVRMAKAGNPPLNLTELSAEMKFVVQKEGAGGLSFVILPVTAELGGKLKSIEIHEISITFQKPK